jgi:hypothetical protein
VSGLENPIFSLQVPEIKYSRPDTFAAFLEQADLVVMMERADRHPRKVCELLDEICLPLGFAHA